MDEHIAGQYAPATGADLDQFATHVRDNCESIADSLEEAAADIEIAILPENPWRAQRVLMKLHTALDGVHRLAASDGADRTVAAALAGIFGEIFRDLEALRRGIPENA